MNEAIDLELFDMNLAGRTATIRRGKGDKARLVPITHRATNVISDYLEESRTVLLQTRLRRRETRIMAPSRALLLSTTGRPLTAQTWCERRLGPLLAAASLPQSLRPHRLRHACAVHLLESGADVLLISRLLGHARLETTAIYLALTTAHLARTLRAHPRERSDG